MDRKYFSVAYVTICKLCKEFCKDKKNHTTVAKYRYSELELTVFIGSLEALELKISKVKTVLQIMEIDSEEQFNSCRF